MTHPDLTQPVNLILSQPSRVGAWQRACVCPAVYTSSLCVGEMTSRASWPGAGKQTLIAEWLLWWRIVCQAHQSGLWVESYVMETRQIDTNNRKHSALSESNVFKWCMLARKTGLFSYAFSRLKGWAMERRELCEKTMCISCSCYMAH